jgi:hypothetical protein
LARGIGLSPVARISSARGANALLQPLEHVLSVRPRVLVRVERGSMFVEDAIGRRVDVVIRHAQQQTTLRERRKPFSDESAMGIPLLKPAAVHRICRVTFNKSRA